MSAPESEDLRRLAAEVASVWKENAFYEAAESYTHLFWNESSLFRRFFDRLDLATTTELSCGHGRHSEVAQSLAGHLTLVDVFEENLTICRRRLRDFRNVSYLLGDGFTFGGIEDGSQTAVFSYGSMVHFSPPVVESYLRDLVRILAPGGMALLHHSNLDLSSDKGKTLADKRGRLHMTRQQFDTYALAGGLEVVDSIEFDWSGVELLDGLTLLRRRVGSVAQLG